MTRSLRKLLRLRRLVIAIGVLAVALSTAALAFWATTGHGQGAGAVGSLAAPTNVAAGSTVGSSVVALSWTAAPAVHGLSPSGYYAVRWKGESATVVGGGCGSASAPVNQTSCSDPNVAEGQYTYTVVSVYRSWTASSTHSASVTVIPDNTPPTTTFATSPATPEGTGGWFRQTVSFTLSASDTGSGVAHTYYTLDGGGTQTYSGSVPVGAQGEHTVAYWSVDRAGNEEAHHTAHVKIDSVAPADQVSLGSATHALLSGSTLYFNPGVTGSFKLTDAPTDATSGPASATFPIVSASGWTHAAETITSPAGGPFTSSSYSWNGGAATPSTTTVTSADTAGNPSPGAALAFVADSTAPTGGALVVDTVAASAGGTTSTSTTTSFTIGSRTDYTEARSASQSGLASSTLTIQSETLAGNACGAPGSGGAYTTATTIAGTSNPAIATGYCYLYMLTGTDAVGNATSVKTTVKVDATPPSSPAVALSGATGSTFLSGTTAYIDAQAGRSGSFKATASASDAESGIASISLPALSGFSAGGGTLASPYETTYTWSGAVAASGAQPATATDGAGLTSTNTGAFTVTADTTPPSGGSVSVPARANVTSVAVTFSAGTDAGSGVSTSGGELLRAEATYTPASDSCAAFGSFAKVGSLGPSSPATDATVASGHCYEYEYKASDNVGNTATFGPSSPVKVNTAGPSLTGIASTNGNGILETGDTLTLTFNEPIAAASVPSSGTLTQSRSGNNAALFTITGLTAGEGWSTGSSSYEEKNKSITFNESATVSGTTVTVKVGVKVEGSGASAGTTSSVTGTVNAAVQDLFGNAASSGGFSISAKLW